MMNALLILGWTLTVIAFGGGAVCWARAMNCFIRHRGSRVHEIIALKNMAGFVGFWVLGIPAILLVNYATP